MQGSRGPTGPQVKRYETTAQGGGPQHPPQDPPHEPPHDPPQDPPQHPPEPPLQQEPPTQQDPQQPPPPQGLRPDPQDPNCGRHRGAAQLILEIT
ncbi:GM18646 [Drosophila sechellia]|nr:GM18646 [Drosophila sechellia]